MKTYGTGRKGRPARTLSALLFLMLVFSLPGGIRAESGLAWDPDLILAADAAVRMKLQKPDGSPLEVRKDPSLPGRGAAPGGSMPDYTGVVGYAALPNDPEISRSYVFDQAYWRVPLYRKTGEGYTQEGFIAHKMPVLVTGQALEPDGSGRCSGFLDVIRLDTGKAGSLDVSCFCTVPYWKLPITEIPAYGYSLAVYRETPGAAPRDEDGQICSLRDGTMVLIPIEGAWPVNNPDPAHLTVQGVVFRDEAGNIVPKAVYFREADLTLHY